MKDSYRKILLSIFILFFVFLFVEQQFDIIKEKRLSGAIKKVEKPKLNTENWFNESFQNQSEKYLNQKFGLRSVFVRVYNQIMYSFFNFAKAKDVIVGKNGYLYEKNYARAVYGHDFIGKDTIKKKLTKLKALQDVFKKEYNIDLITIYTIGKGSYYKEYIPDRFVRKEYKTNLEYHLKYSEDIGLRYIDFNSYFLKLKDTTKYPLVPKTGIHMSYYGDYIFVDSLTRYIEKLRNIKMPKLRIDTFIVSKPDIYINNKLFLRDEDIEEGMNLLFNIKDQEMAYPIVSIDSAGCKKLKVIAMGDSYWDYPSRNFTRQIFKDERYWFYNYYENPHVPYWNHKRPLYNLDEVGIIKSRDLIIVIITDASFPAFSFEFIDRNYERFVN